jgi:hypothetical protein
MRIRGEKLTEAMRLANQGEKGETNRGAEQQKYDDSVAVNLYVTGRGKSISV